MPVLRTLSRTALSTAALAVIAFAPAHAEVSKDPSKAAAGAYTLDTRHTNVSWTVSHLGFSNFVGTFEKAEGTLNYDPVDPTKSVLKVTIDTNSLHTNVDGFAKELTAGAGWIDAAKGPVTFTSTKVTKTGEITGTVEGDLTLNGVTKPATLAVTFVGAGKNDFAQANAIGFSATTTIKRSDFGVDKLVPAISDDVTIRIETEFLQKLAAPAKQ